MLSIKNNTTSIKQIITLSGVLNGMDALDFRDKTSTIIEIKEGQLSLDISNIHKIDLTGFNAVVMLKKEAAKRKISFCLVATTDNPIHEFIHLSKLPIQCINRLSN